MKKRGLAGIVTTVIILLLVISAIAIIWATLSGRLFSGLKGLPSQVQCLQAGLELEGCVRNVTSGNNYIAIKRNIGIEDIQQIRIILTNSTNLTYFDEPPMQELESIIYIYNINFTDISSYAAVLVGPERVPCTATQIFLCQTTM